MATTPKQRPSKRKRPAGNSRRLVLLSVLVGSTLLAAGSAALVRQRVLSSRSVAEEVAILEPPAIEAAGVDPAIVRAIETARTAVTQSPRSVAAWGLLGKTLLANGFELPASTCLAQAERLDPAQARWPYLRGIALASADPPDPDAAILAFQRAVELGGDTPDMLRLRLGEALLKQDRLEEAEQQFERVLERDSANARAHLDLARVAIRRGEPEKSRDHLERAATDAHTKKASRLLLAQVQQRLGKEPSADEVRDTAHLPADTSWPDPFADEVAALKTGMKANLRRAEWLLNHARMPEAIALLRQIVHDYPDSYYAWLTFGRALTKQKNLKAAEQALNTALKLAPDSAETQFYLGVALSYQGNYRGAEPLFRGATEVKPNYAAAHYNLGHCLLHRGDRAGAIEAFQVALRCQADFADAHTSLSMQLVEVGRRAEAWKHARLALQYNPADATAKQLLRRLWPQFTIPTGP